jgi:hypothetical protein
MLLVHFIFKKENITDDQEKALTDYISEYKKEEAESNGMSMVSLHVYDDVLIIEEEDTRIAPVLIPLLPNLLARTIQLLHKAYFNASNKEPCFAVIF